MKIFITGTSRGVGYLIANLFIDLGHEVYGLSRSQATITNASYHHFVADLNSLESLQRVTDSLEDLDVLINCAGIANMNPFLLSESSDFLNMFQVNVMAPYLLTRELAKKMIASGCGRVINISTMATSLNIKGELQYIVTKSALEKFTVAASRELSSFGITVNTIGLSLVKTDLLKGVTEEQLKNLKSQLSFPQFLEEKDILHTLLFFIDKNARYITGQTVNFGGVCF